MQTVITSQDKTGKPFDNRALKKRVGCEGMEHEEGFALAYITRSKHAKEISKAQTEDNLRITEMKTASQCERGVEDRTIVRIDQMKAETDVSQPRPVKTGKPGLDKSDLGDHALAKHGRNSSSKLGTDKRVALAGKS